MDNAQPKRKTMRLANYDYSQNGFYFITICTQNHNPILGYIEDGKMVLNKYAEGLDNLLHEIIFKKHNILLDKYVFMPNHIHMILVIENDSLDNNGSDDKTGIFELVKEFKSHATRTYIDGVKKGLYAPFEKKLWQRSYYDNIIRNETTYEEIWEYIDNNPLKWALDKYYYNNE